MSAKNYDNYQRWRSKTVSFRMSPEEADQLDKLVKLSGLSKQDYLIARTLQRDVKVVGNPRVYKALRDTLAEVLSELRRIAAGESVDYELLELIEQIDNTLYGMKGDGASEL